jgi:hypothetical protein
MPLKPRIIVHVAEANLDGNKNISEGESTNFQTCRARSHSAVRNLCSTERKLLDFWTVFTSNTIAKGGDEGQLWHSALLPLALQHEFLLDAILSLTSFHWVHLVTSPPASLPESAMGYYVDALRKFQERLNKPTTETLPALYFCSLVLVYILFARHAVERRGRAFESATTLLCDATGMWRGSCQILRLWRNIIAREFCRASLEPGATIGHEHRRSSETRRFTNGIAVEFDSPATDSPATDATDALRKFEHLIRTEGCVSMSRLLWAGILPLILVAPTGEFRPLASFESVLTTYSGLWWIQDLGQQVGKDLVATQLWRQD